MERILYRPGLARRVPTKASLTIRRRNRYYFIAAIVFLYRQKQLLSQIIITDNIVDHPDPPIISSTNSTTAIIVNKENSQTITTKRQRRRISGGFLTTHTGCRICKWLYSQESNATSLTKDCKGQPPNCQLRHREVQQQLRENDTIYVPFTEIQQFVDEILNDIVVDVVIISGQFQNVPNVSDNTIDTLLNHPRVLHWFSQNIPKYGGSNPAHRKLSPFPYGLKERGFDGELTFESYKRVYFKYLNSSSSNNNDKNTTTYDKKKKETLIYAGPLGRTNPSRRNVPRSNKRLDHEAYFTKIAQSRYILSPNGDRPDCFRHYEALGLGTIPITELDPVLFRHLAGGPVVFGTEDWRMRSLEERVNDPAMIKEHMVVNRNLIREDYWMDWVEEEVGIGELNWRDFE